MKRFLTRPQCFLPIAAIALLATACDSAQQSTAPAPAPESSQAASVTIAEPSPDPEPGLTALGDPYERGVQKATSARNLANTAESKEDWQFVAFQWQQAVEAMRAVPKNDRRATDAKKLAAAFQRELSRAQQQAKRGGAIRTAKTPARSNASSGNGTIIVVGGKPSGQTSKEAATTLSSLNQSQIDFFSKQKRFAASLSELGNSAASDNGTYTYATVPVQPTQVMSTAVAKQDGLPSYTGAVFAAKDKSGKENTVAIVCATKSPSKVPPAMPQLVNNQPQCPAESTKVS